MAVVVEAAESPSAPLGHVVYRHRVRYHETDAQFCVFNARYLEFVDVAMAEYFRRRGWSYRELIAAGCDPSLVTVTLEFTRSAAVDDELEISVATREVGRSSFRLFFDIRRAPDDAEIATAEVVYVNVDVATGASRPLPDAVRARLTDHEQELSTS